MRLSSGDKSKKKSIGFSYALNGIRVIFKSERNFRIHFFATIVVGLLGFCVKLSLMEWSIVVLAIGIVLVAETTNTAVEKLIDYLKPEVHESAKIIKDIAAGAVLIAAIMAFILGCLIFIPKFIHFF